MFQCGQPGPGIREALERDASLVPRRYILTDGMSGEDTGLLRALLLLDIRLHHRCESIQDRGVETALGA